MARVYVDYGSRSNPRWVQISSDHVLSRRDEKKKKKRGRIFWFDNTVLDETYSGHPRTSGLATLRFLDLHARSWTVNDREQVKRALAPGNLNLDRASVGIWFVIFSDMRERGLCFRVMVLSEMFDWGLIRLMYEVSVHLHLLSVTHSYNAHRVLYYRSAITSQSWKTLIYCCFLIGRSAEEMDGKRVVDPAFGSKLDQVLNWFWFRVWRQSLLLVVVMYFWKEYGSAWIFPVTLARGSWEFGQDEVDSTAKVESMSC